MKVGDCTIQHAVLKKWRPLIFQSIHHLSFPQPLLQLDQLIDNALLAQIIKPSQDFLKCNKDIKTLGTVVW